MFRFNRREFYIGKINDILSTCSDGTVEAVYKALTKIIERGIE